MTKTVEFETYLTIPIKVKAQMIEGMTQLFITGEDHVPIMIDSLPEDQRSRLYEIAKQEAQIENGNNSETL